MRQRFFVARELQATIAILVVIALLGGIVLQFASKTLTDFLGLDDPNRKNSYRYRFDVEYALNRRIIFDTTLP